MGPMRHRLLFLKEQIVCTPRIQILSAKEKLDIVSGAALPPFRIFALLRLSASDGQAVGFPRRRRRNAFGLIQEYCTRQENAIIGKISALACRYVVD